MEAEKEECPFCGGIISKNAQRCKHCGELIDDNSRQSKFLYTDKLPEQYNKFNWGAFCLSWIWGIGNKTYIAFVSLALAFIPFVGGLCSLAFSIWLGIKGNQLAWKNKNWKSLEHFNSVQRLWAVIGAIVFGVSFVFGIMAGIMAHLVK